MGKLWEKCLSCSDKCCNWDVVYPLFVTQEEMDLIRSLYPKEAKSLNKVRPCPFLREDGLCMIHPIKPIDCRLFPFDIAEIDGKLFWIVWQFNCPILDEEDRFEEYLREFEERLLPGFAQHMRAYALFRFDELSRKHRFKVLREVEK